MTTLFPFPPIPSITAHASQALATIRQLSASADESKDLKSLVLAKLKPFNRNPKREWSEKLEDGVSCQFSYEQPSRSRFKEHSLSIHVKHRGHGFTVTHQAESFQEDLSDLKLLTSSFWLQGKGKRSLENYWPICTDLAAQFLSRDTDHLFERQYHFGGAGYLFVDADRSWMPVDDSKFRRFDLSVMELKPLIKGVVFGPMPPPYGGSPLKVEAKASFGLTPSFEFGMTSVYLDGLPITSETIDGFFEPFFASAMGVFQGVDPVVGLRK